MSMISPQKPVGVLPVISLELRRAERKSKISNILQPIFLEIRS